jgi:hypothetical protein
MRALRGGYIGRCMGRNGQIRGQERYKEANDQGTALLNTVELDVGWQAFKRNLEIDYKRDIWLI